MQAPETYVLRPVVVQAIRWDGSNCVAVFGFLGVDHEPHDDEIDEVYLPGGWVAHMGNWIVKRTDSGLTMFDVLQDHEFHRKFAPKHSVY